MKLAVLASLVGAASAFAPASTGGARAVISLNEKSPSIPFLPYPENCKGYVGDVGFDPLRVSDYFPMDYLRESELKHGRICMMAWLGFVAVDLGARIYPLPTEWEGLTSATAHDKLVEYGAMGNMLIWFGMLEMCSWLAVSSMLQGSGREPGYYGFGARFLEGKSEAEVEKIKLQEIKNGRLAMLAFSGVVTQSVLYNSGFPYLG